MTTSEMGGCARTFRTDIHTRFHRERTVEGPLTLTLVDVSHRTQSSGGLADFTSTLEVMGDDIDNGTNIICKGTTDEEYVVIYKRGIVIGTLKIEY